MEFTIGLIKTLLVANAVCSPMYVLGYILYKMIKREKK